MKENIKAIAIYGAGGFGKEVAMLVEQINQASYRWDIIGFFDDGIKKHTRINNYLVLGGIEEIEKINMPISIVIAIGDPQRRAQIKSRILNKFVNYPTLIHPSAIIGSFTNIGEGTIISANCTLTVNIDIGEFVILNLCTTIGHDSKLASYVSVMPGVNISGSVEISSCVYIGTGTQILGGVQIGKNAIVGAGALVNKSFPAGSKVYGVPARIISMANSFLLLLFCIKVV